MRSEKAPSTRQKRVAEMVKEILGEKLTRGDIHHPDISSLITISHVDVSPDLRHAKVFFSTLDKKTDMQSAQNALNELSRTFGQEVARHMRTKYTPRLKFYQDDSFDKAANLDALLKSTGDV